jgi:very-short-patch-repair endonuclease
VNTYLPNNWEAIREHYQRVTPKILAERRDEWAIDAYEWDGENMIFMTPIEYWLWGDIRECGAIFYPQYPVGRFFVDFANPVAKVALECDGAAFHTDKAKDAARDAQLEAMGWSVYRFPGWMCKQDHDEETGRLSEIGARLRRIVIDHQICRNHLYDVFEASLERYALGEPA